MKIEIEVPDWVETDGHNLYFMSGIETIGIKYPGQQWQIKTDKCSNCGACCAGWRDSDEFPPQHNGICDYRTEEGSKKICSLGLNRPFACCVSIVNIRSGCTQRFEEMK